MLAFEKLERQLTITLVDNFKPQFQRIKPGKGIIRSWFQPTTDRSISRPIHNLDLRMVQFRRWANALPSANIINNMIHYLMMAQRGVSFCGFQRKMQMQMWLDSTLAYSLKLWNKHGSRHNVVMNSASTLQYKYKCCPAPLNFARWQNTPMKSI